MKLPLLLFLCLLILPLVTAEWAGPTYCHQETANISTACGGLSSGSYSSYGTQFTPLYIFDNAWDGNYTTSWRTNATTSGGIFINYTIPLNATNNSFIMSNFDSYYYWNMSFNDTVQHISECLFQDTYQLWINVTPIASIYRLNYSCWEGTAWTTIMYLDQNNANWVFEESVYWDMTDTTPTSLTFIGASSGTDYTNTTYCTLGGSQVPTNGTYWILPIGNSTIQCTGTDQYPSFNHSFTNLNGSQHHIETITVQEYSTTLNWDTNVTGTVFWGCIDLRHCQEILEDSTRYNPATFEYSYVPTTWDEDIFITFYWNNQSYGANASAQYFDIINEYTSTTTEYNLTTLTTLDFNLWLEILNYGEEVLYGSTIQVYYNPNSTYDHTLVGQRITQPVSGDAMKGPLFYLDRTLSYTIVITHPGYQQRTIQLRGYDFDSDLKLQIKLLPNDLTLDYDYTVTGPHSHHNHSTLDYTIGHPNGGTYYYSTSYLTSRTERTFTNGGDTITLTLSTHYEPNSNFTLNIWSRNDTTGTYTLETTHDVTYQPWDEKDFTTTISSTNTVLNILLWIAIIAISSIIGVIIKKDGIDTGYYAYNAATFIVAIFNLFFLPIAILNGLVLLGSLVTNVIRD